MQDITRSADHVVLFGITCGMSAPYVAGQIDYAMNKVSLVNIGTCHISLICGVGILIYSCVDVISLQTNYTAVLVGFNPVELSRSAPIEKWDKTCKDVSVP